MRIRLSLTLGLYWGILGGLIPDVQAQTEPPDVLTFDVSIDETMQPGAATDAMSRDLRLTAERHTDQPRRVQATLQLPALLGGRTEVRELDLTQAKQAEATVPLTFPAGPPQVAVIPVTVRVNGEDYLDLDVRLSKVDAWKVLGPFPGGREASHDRAFSPEEKIDLTATYEGWGGKRIAWEPFDPAAINAEGYHDLNLALGYTEFATAYALASVTVPPPSPPHAGGSEGGEGHRAVPARLLIGSDDSIKVWHHGQLVHDHNLHRGSAPAQDTVNVELMPGENVFLLKICNDDGWWGFHFDLDDGAGKPLPGLRWNVGVARRFIQDPQLRLRDVQRTSATLTWQSDRPEATTVYVVAADPGRRLVWGAEPREAMNSPAPGAPPLPPLASPQSPPTLGGRGAGGFRAAKRTTNHTFTVTDLQAGTRYLAWVDPAIKGGRSDKLTFYTAPPEGRTHYLRLNLVAAVFTNTTQQRFAELEGAREPCPAAMVERMKREMEEARRFYWVNTGMRLLLDVDYLITDEFLVPPNDNAYGVGFTELDEALLRQRVEQAGKNLSDYDGRLFISMEKLWDEPGRKWWYPASGGGTIGPEGEPGMGKSAWKGGSHNGWLFCHEFGHQLDALYHHSHGPEYLFNHPQPWDDTAHRHGEHYDANAWLLWEWAGYVTRDHQARPFLPPSLGFRYLMNRWGRVVPTADADNDGVPDDAPEVPLDEKRLGSSPQAADTDGDGLSDLLEVMACEWVDYGLSEIWAGDPNTHRCDPTKPDTDGDGVPDGADPYPLYPIDPNLRKGAARPFVKLQDLTYQADFQLGWDDEFLTFGMTAAEAPEEVRVMLDANDDGWFMGGDNFLFTVRPEGGLGAGGDRRTNADGTFAAAFHNCAVQDKWPFFDPTRLQPDEVKFEQAVGEGRYTMAIKVPRNATNGVELAAGERLGLLLAVAPRGGPQRPEQTGMLTVFEPHRFVAVTLRE